MHSTRSGHCSIASAGLVALRESGTTPGKAMTIPAPPPADPVRWLNNQPYLLLSLTALFWAGNIVLGRYVAGHVPPMTLSCVRWVGALFMLLPFAWPHLKRDWPALRARLSLMVVLSATGFAINNTLSYWALQYTQALNALLIQSSGPLLLLPFSIWEFSTGFTLKFDALTLATLIYVVIFPSTLAYLFFNRGIALIGPNRAAPFFHLVPVFGSAMAILLLGEQPRLFHLTGYVLVLAGVVIASRQASAAG